MNQFVISIMTRDRVGIVADVTGIIRELEGNLADLSQTVLCGYFTMIVIASFPPQVAAAEIRRRLVLADPEVPFEVGIKVPQKPVESDRNEYNPGHFILTAVGPDKIGLVAAVSGFLRNQGISICDLTTCVDDGRYVMIIAVDLPGERKVGDFRQEIRRCLAPLGVQVEIQHHGIFRAINEV